MHRMRLAVESTEADGLTRAQVEDEMVIETTEAISGLSPADAQEVVREHLPPWLRNRFVDEDLE